ncbi:MAG TPA: hypothetical protein PLT08_17030, partial [Anaerolineales bacterium]|nr:hypothetical protein [Anaerolineales bacterium]
GRLRSQLNGNLAFISGEQVVATETRSIQGNQDVSIPVDVSSTTDLQPQVIPERPAWILPTIVSTIVLIVIVLIVIGAQTFMQKRSDKQE